MGKGDKRTRRGKIWRGSHGKTRSRKLEKAKSTTKKTAVKPAVPAGV